MCRSPRYPQRNPNPRAYELSGSKISEASLSFSLRRASFRSSYSSLNMGYSPENTIGFTSLNPFRGLSVGARKFVTVSPIFVSTTVFIAATIYPTSPGIRASRFSLAILKCPTSVTVYTFSVDQKRIWSSFFTVPSYIRTFIITPTYLSKKESKISALRGLSGSPWGGGITSTIRSRSSSMPIPSFAEVSTAFSASRPRLFSILFFVPSISALGISILLITGIISRSFSRARYMFAMVCASTPWDASTRSRTPSQAARARETSYVKSTWPGVSIRLNTYSSPFCAV